MRKRRYSIDFASHMAACDANYDRLMMLAPEIRYEDRREYDVRVGSMVTRLLVKVIERCPYTTTLQLTQRLIEHELYPAPSMTVRLYHDAATAEVTEYQNQRAFLAVYPYPNERMLHPDEKAQINRLLSELLDHCLDYGVASRSLVVN